MATSRPAVPARKYPTAKAGNYAAPADTAGMDPEMKKTLGIGTTPAPKKSGIDWWKILGIKH